MRDMAQLRLQVGRLQVGRWQTQMLLLLLPSLPKGPVEPRPPGSDPPPPGLSEPGPYAPSPWVLLLPPRLSSSSCSLKSCFYFPPRPLAGGAPCALWQQEAPP